MKVIARLALPVAALALAGCASPHVAAARQTVASPSSSFREMQTATVVYPTPAVVTDGAPACTRLTDNNDLRTAEGFVLVSNLLKPGDVAALISELGAVRDSSPVELEVGVVRLIGPMRALEEAIDAQKGATVDASAVTPAIAQIVAYCQGHGYATPAS